MLVPFHEVFKTMRYPAGETHVELLETGTFAIPTHILCDHVRGWDDLMGLVVAQRIIDSTIGRPNSVKFIVPYFPFGRHDRRKTRGDGDELNLAIVLLRG